MTKKEYFDRKKVGLMVAMFGFAVIATLAVVSAYGGVGTPKVVVEGDYIEAAGQSAGEMSFGAIGSMYVEDYVPVIKFNEGYYSGLPISLTGADGDLTISSNGTLTLSGINTINGTTTISNSYDGMILQANFTMATGTAKAVVSNNTGVNMLCSDGFVYFDSTAFSPAIQFAVGTSTSATGYSKTLTATTTVATTTDSLFKIPDVLSGSSTSSPGFILPSGQSITATLADAIAGMASSTNYGNWDAEMAFSCWLMGQ